MLMADQLDYLFVAQYIVEAKQVLDDGNNFIWRQKPTRHLTASQAKDQAVLSQCVRKDQAYRFMLRHRDVLLRVTGNDKTGTPTYFVHC